MNIKGVINYPYNRNYDAIKLSPGSLIRLTHSRRFPTSKGAILVRLQKNLLLNSTEIVFINIKNGSAYSTVDDFKWEIIKET